MPSINQFNADEKILNYPDKLDYFFNGGKTLIVTELDLTNKCNNKCPNCIGNKENGAELDWETILRIADGLRILDNKGVIISGGGEPLMSPYFADALPLLRINGMKIGLNSNGLALTTEISEVICKYCEYFRISLDAGTADTYKFTHGMDKAAFDKVVNNIKMFARIKKQLESDISFGVGFLTGEKTAEDIESFVSLAKESGADFAQLRPLAGDFTDISKEYAFCKEKYEDASFKVSASAQKYKQFKSADKRPYSKCRGMFFSTVITADAGMYACLHHRQNPNYFLGSIKEKSIPEIWYSHAKWKVFEEMDLENCPVFCRNDSFNRILDNLNRDTVHKEFL